MSRWLFVGIGSFLGALMAITAYTGNWVLFLVAALLFLVNLMALGWHHV